jgi:hypothetical protein
MNPAAKLAYQKLCAACRVKDRVRRTAWVVWILALVLLVLLTAALVDYWLVLPFGVRFACAGLLALLLTAGLLRFLQLLRRPTSVKEVALDTESLQPNLGCMVSTAAEYLTGERKIVHEYEPELVDALQAQAASALKQTKLPYWKNLQVPAAFMAGTLALLLGFVALASSALTALKRVTVPFSNAAYTRVEVKPGTTEIPAGKDVEVEAVFRGRKPAGPTLQWRRAPNSKWQSVKLTPDDAGRGTHSLKAVQGPLIYRVTGGDAQSPDFFIKTYVPPAVKDLRIQLDYPAYTKRQPVIQDSPEIVVVRGSVASFRVVPTVPISGARLRFEKAPALNLRPGPDNGFTRALSITNDTDYWIELTDEAIHLGVNEKPYHIKALPDEPPKVEIVEPGQDIRADATNTIHMKVSAVDDFGVDEIKLVYHKLGGPEQTVLARTESERNGEVTAVVELPLAPLQLKDYELVAYHAEARDNNALDGPGVGKSPMYFIEITNEEGGPSNCKSKCNGQKVNLLVIQKQIIADTQALAENAGAGVFKEIADRENEAVHFGRMYLEAIASGGAPAQAVDEMKSAIQDMTAATVALNENNRDSALPPEESALARFYQVLKLMPELEDLPTEPPPMAGGAGNKGAQSPMIKVVLEAIKKQQKENPDNKEIAELLERLQQLQRSQSALNQACQNPSNNPNGSSNAQNAKQSPQAPQTQAEKAGQLAPGTEALARQQDQLSEEAAALAKRLATLAGKDVRLGHNLTRTMNSAPPKMGAAAQALKSGNRQGGYAHGKDTYYTLNTVISMLQKILELEGRLADISSEEYPKEYDRAIRDYLKRLSYEE